MSQQLSKGANTALPSSDVRVEVRSSTLLDIAAILVTPTGKVRSDADFVFFNQPTGPGVRLLPPSALAFGLVGVPADIDKIVVTGSLDGSGPATFAAVRDLVVVVLDGRGSEVASFTPTGLTTETALVMVELYRRQGAWKLRAVGQGYASGLAGIATDFGVDVGDPPPPAAVPVPQPVPQPVSRPVPPSAPAAPPRPVSPAVPPAAANRPVNLDKGRVSLRKGQSVSLVKTGAPPLNKVRMGLGWDPAHGERDIDLDASCILYDERGKDVDKVWFMSKKGAKGAVRHSGDNLTGQGEGDDEVIFVDLGALPSNVWTLVFTVNSFQGQPFTAVRNAFCRLIDDHSNAELVRFDLSDSKPQTGLVMCKVQRDRAAPGSWTMTAIGEFHDGKTVRAMTAPAKQYL